jgi:hypothetical protein
MSIFAMKECDGEGRGQVERKDPGEISIFYNFLRERKVKQ